MSIRDDFFANQAVAALWDVAVSIKRGNPLPLDSNSVFKSYADLETYASGVLAYPGQIVAVVNVDSTEIYFLDQELAIKPVGSVPAADNKSIEVVDGVLSIHNYGSSYYKYVKEVKDEATGEIITPAGYDKVEVSDSNPWIEGLEPRVTTEDGELVIGWFQPNPTTIDGVQTQIADLQKTVEEIVEEIGDPAKDELTPATGLYLELDKKADKISTYTKTEVDNLIASVDHLKRKIFDTLDLAQEFINNNPDTAHQYIYMIPSGLQVDSNRFYEYMIIDGALEQIGNWEVDLDDYFTESELQEYLEGYYTGEQVQAILVDYATKTDLEGYYSIDQIDNLLASYYTSEKVNELLNNYVVKEEGKSLVEDSEIEKLKTVKANAEPNFIKSVSSNFTVSDAGHLTLNKITIAQVEDLQESLDNKVTRTFTENADGSKTEWILLSPENQRKLNALNITDTEDLEISGTVNAANVKELDSWITVNRDTVIGLYPSSDQTKLSKIQEGAEKNFIASVDETQFIVSEDRQLILKEIPAQLLTNLSSDFTYVENVGLTLAQDYVTTSLYRSEVGDLTQLIKATEGEGPTTIVDEINYINERLQWQTIEE